MQTPQPHLSTVAQRGTARSACLAALDAGYAPGHATRIGSAAGRRFHACPVLTPYDTGREVPLSEFDAFMSLLEPASYILTVATAIWTHGNN